jgi:bifunctional DNase/RNase
MVSDERLADEVPVPYVPVRVVDVAVQLPNPNPVLVLEEIAGAARIVRIPIGMAEGVAIAYGLAALETPKPLSHQLMHELIDCLGGVLEAARITSVSGTSFAAELVITAPSGQKVLSCRPSDAVALALRSSLNAPITVAEAVFDQLINGGASG